MRDQHTARPISTHTPRTGSDPSFRRGTRLDLISTHTPRTGSDSSGGVMLLSDVAFQPTLPARGATAKNCGKPLYRTNFNPHSPHGERPPVPGAKPVLIYFNPHSPHGERRGPPGRTTALRSDFNPHSPHGERRRSGVPAGFYPAFQPTLPARGATRPPRAELPAQVHISTHTPRTGSDCSQSCPWASPCYFNPHSPHGERRCCWAARQRREVFQPTLPARGATAGQCQSSRQSAISTHTPRTGSDALGFFSIIFDGISTHTPRTGSDVCAMSDPLSQTGFQPTLPARGATQAVRGTAG